MIPQWQTNQRFINDSGKLERRAGDLVRDLIQLDILEGSGSPEGVVVAFPRRIYMNTSGSAGNILFIKRDADIGGDRTQGWILV